ncbi:MAG: hypothetical protein Q9181_006747 [Wetmoreana brouardii]
MAIEAAFQNTIIQGTNITVASRYSLREVVVSRSMVLSDDAGTEVSLVLRPQREGTHAVSKTWNHFSVFSCTSDGGWAEHCQGLISRSPENGKPNPVNGLRATKNQHSSRQEYNSKLEQLCQKSLKPSDIYARFARRGLDFGPAFRNITAASAAEGYSTATVTVPDTAKMMPYKHQSIYVIHPGTLDACFQVTDFAASGGDLSRSDIHVPTFVKSIEIRHALFMTPGHNITRSAGSPLDPEIRASFSVFDTKLEGELLFEVGGLVVSKLPSQETDIGQLGERGLCYKMVWEPCIDLLKPEQYTQVLSGSLSCPDSTDQIQSLERAAFYYIQRALESITLAETDHFPPHLQRLYSVLCTLLKQGNRGCLPFQNMGWFECSEAAKQAFLVNLEASDDSGRLVCNMGQQLATIFRGDIEPLSIMLQDNRLGTYYRGHSSNIRGNEIAATTLETLAHQAPHIKIIELGAGTGIASMPILRAIGTRFAHYDFTDISTGFFEGAREEQAAWAGKISKAAAQSPKASSLHIRD